ncbi:methyl-accepting chemotaxis protein [Paraburkholderia sp. MMS20-SJTN17]|uniref:Methyl-accepting chemotaxis protein n=1 Tax=Paraburkholderia translucens TaxID=2886945 RepID=A0ABS8KCN0_9BURK|nr:methyl-accepting chemotaxis protein [Paraburkholderia sp. MMS20-SJTN17]MCC8402528.1 methyl-accepting chemotaxis protein [Paraburkholderia sp. MMS20-SJTN17]
MHSLLPLKTQVRRHARTLAGYFPAPFIRDASNGVDILGVMTPRLLNGNTLLNLNYDEVDRFTAETRATGTLFVGIGEDFVRVATSVKKQTGERAVGTVLDRSHPGYGMLRRGQPYTGYATLFGKQYMTRYEPIRDSSGEVIGALYVGLDVSEVWNLSIGARLALLTLGANTALLLGYGRLLQAVIPADRPDPAAALPSLVQSEVIGFGLIGALLVSALVYVTTRRGLGMQLLEAKAAAEKLAAGDLTAQVHVSRRDELGQLMQAMNGISVGLASVVGNVRRASDMIATGAREIAAGNAELSSRTEAQAGSLEKTASTMEQLTAMVRANADRASNANQHIASASDLAVKGGDVVGHVVTTMSLIRGSSHKIVDIIGMIDSIAFQTNILALNAAVEAARAGDQGRGFAVVAAEVRSLAQRSAMAAKEIKALITDSVGNVKTGSELVDQAGRDMTEIVRAVDSVVALMGEITHASNEQSAGIGEINRAIGQMDERIQQNVALVEQVAAAAASMQEQACTLEDAVQVFRLVTDAPNRHSRSVPQSSGTVDPRGVPQLRHRGG